MSRKDRSQRIDFTRKRFGVCKWQYEKLDDIDLLIEVGILSNCKLIYRCRPCRHNFRFCLQVLMNKWDEFRFFSIENALKIVKSNKKLLQTSIVLDHYSDNQKLLKKITRQCRTENNAYDLILEHRSFFFEAIGKNLKIKNYLHGFVRNNEDPFFS